MQSRASWKTRQPKHQQSRAAGAVARQNQPKGEKTMNANHITATTTINHMRPLTLVAFIRDLADAPDTLPRERADLLRATLDALSASIGAQNAIALLAAADVQADHPIVAGMVDAWVQPDMFPAGEDTPLFTQPDTPMVLFPDGEYHELPAPEDAAPAEPEPCSRCNRRPEESGVADWDVCDYCGKPACDTCAFDTHGHRYCSDECWRAATEY